jgi:hypothetical protein
MHRRNLSVIAPAVIGGYPPYGYAPYLGGGELHVHYHTHR